MSLFGIQFSGNDEIGIAFHHLPLQLNLAPHGIESSTKIAEKYLFTKLPWILDRSMPLACEGGHFLIIGMLTVKLWFRHVYLTLGHVLAPVKHKQKKNNIGSERLLLKT